LYDFEWTIVGNLAFAMLLKMCILKMSSNTEIREKGECAAARAVGQGLSHPSTTSQPLGYYLLFYHPP
jgi:hypothetical protein